MWEFLLTVIAILVGILYLIGRKKHSFWESRGVFSPDSGYLPFLGHAYSIYVKQFRWEYIDKLYKKNKDKRFWGFYEVWTPSIMVLEPELLKTIFVKEANKFIDRRYMEVSKADQYFKEFLTVLKGKEWKQLRNLSTPTFSSGKIKGMFPLVNEKVDYFIEKCQKVMKEDDSINMKDMFACFSLDVIGTCAFGIEIDSMKNNSSPFIEATNSAINPPKRTWIKFMLLIFCPRLFNALGLGIESDGMKFIKNGIEESINSRRSTGIKRGDYLDLMLNALEECEKNKDSEDFKEANYPMTINTVISSCILFLMAGYDTTSNALAFAAYVLAKNTEAQDTLREELTSILENQKELSYQNVMECKYLDACFSETLRMYGPIHLNERMCTESFKIPDSDVEIPKGMMVYIPTHSIHYDPDYFEEPEIFKPERFMPENSDLINPYTYMPWGHGPRNCIGMRFALMEAKLVLAKLVLNFEMSLKPGYEMELCGLMTTMRPNDKGVQLILEPIYQENISSDSEHSP